MRAQYNVSTLFPRSVLRPIIANDTPFLEQSRKVLRGLRARNIDNSSVFGGFKYTYDLMRAG
jgi:hypothetical protein